MKFMVRKRITRLFLVSSSLAMLVWLSVQIHQETFDNSSFKASMIANDSLYLWSVDFHAAPISCNQAIFERAGSQLHAEIDFHNCAHFPGTCKKRLKVLSYDVERGYSLDPCPGRLKRQFYEAYKDDPEFARVDAFICSHPVANCELFLPFNKSLIVYATTRIEFGRFDENIYWRRKYITEESRLRWMAWLNNLVVLAQDKRNVIAANNLYDVFAIEYFTGIRALYLPSWCGGCGSDDNDYEDDSDDDSTIDENKMKRFTVILGPYRDFSGTWNHPIFDALKAALKYRKERSPYSFERLRDLYPTYKSMSILKKHPCLVLIPYQVSIMSFFEYYRQAIPMYVPSKTLLLTWDQKYHVMDETIYGHVKRESFLTTSVVQDDDATSSSDASNSTNNTTTSRWFALKRNNYQRVDSKLLPPDIDMNILQSNSSSLPNPALQSSLASWIHYCDFYIFPHIQTFDSWPDLINQIESNAANGRHHEISMAMKRFSRQQKTNLVDAWSMIFDQLKEERKPGSATVPPSFEAGLEAFYSDSNLPVWSFNELVDNRTCRAEKTWF